MFKYIQPQNSWMYQFFPECNEADTDWYVRKATDPPLVEPKVLLGLFKEEDTTQGPTFPRKDSQLPSGDGWECMLKQE